MSAIVYFTSPNLKGTNQAECQCIPIIYCSMSNFKSLCNQNMLSHLSQEMCLCVCMRERRGERERSEDKFTEDRAGLNPVTILRLGLL